MGSSSPKKTQVPDHVYAVILAGGSGTLLGAFLGMLIISMIDSGLVFYGVSGNWAQFVTGVVIIAAIALDHVIKRRRSPADAASEPL